MCHSHHMTKQTPSCFDGRHAHCAALASFIQSIAGDFLMTCLSWRLWNESKRAHYVGVNPHVPMLYVSTETIKALYSLRRSPSDMLRFPTQRDHSLWKATAASCFLRVTSSTSHSNEPSLRVFRRCSTSRVFHNQARVVGLHLETHYCCW